MFRIEMFPAAWGDCLWIEYGDTAQPRRILIDGGITATYKVLEERITRLHPNDRHFELLIITHIDADHIEGIVKLLGSVNTLGLSFGDVWFNGWKHLPRETGPEEDGKLGGVQAEFLSALIESKGLPWNKKFQGKCVAVSENGTLPRATLNEGMRLTILSPSVKALRDLRPKWAQAVEEAGLAGKTLEEVLAALQKRTSLRPQDEMALGEKAVNVERLAKTIFVSDDTKPNGSSIAVLAEYEDKRCLLTGDAHVPILQESVEKLLQDSGSERLKLNALKLPHHGSRANISVGLLRLLNCPKYLFSSNGKKYFHPDLEAVARVIAYGGKHPTLCFNYRTEYNEMWDDIKLKEDHQRPYEAVYPSAMEGGCVIEL